MKASAIAAALPWTDRQGRLSPLKAAIFAAAVLPGLFIAWQWQAGELGPRPFDQAIHEIGLWSVRFLLVTLAVTPLRRLADWPRITIVRRMLGLTALGYALIHLLLYAFDQKLVILTILSEIVLRTYLTIGAVALIGLGVLGWTSTDGWLRRLGPRWKRLHRWVYLLTALALLHAFMQAKSNASEAVIMTGCFWWLMAWRALPGRRQAIPWSLLALVPAVLLATVLTEFAWYALGTKLPAMRILAANLDLALAPRPAAWVALAAIAVAVIPWIARAVRRPGWSRQAAPPRGATRQG